MKIKEGGGMGIQEDFLNMQIAYEKNCAVRCNCSYEELKAQLDKSESLFGTRYLEGSPRHENWMLWVQSWQAAKAQAVPDLGELQERIAGHQYYHDEHGHMIVDMDDVVKEISGFDSWKSQAVPEGFVLVKKVHPDAIVHNQGLGLFKECQVIYGWDGKSKDFKDALNKGFYHGVKLGAKAVLETAMIEAQEPAND